MKRPGDDPMREKKVVEHIIEEESCLEENEGWGFVKEIIWQKYNRLGYNFCFQYCPCLV